MFIRERFLPNSIITFYVLRWPMAFILFFVALALRLGAILSWQFDGLYGQDAYAYFQQALAILRNLPLGQPPPADFFWPNGYPLLIAFFSFFTGPTPWAGQLAALLSGSLLPPLIYLLSQDIFSSQKLSPGFGDLGIKKEIKNSSNPLIPAQNQSLFRKISNSLVTRSSFTGLWAGLMVAFAGQPILSSVVIMADMPALFWATLAAWLVVRAGRSEQGSTGREAGEQRRISTAVLWFLAAGFSLAMAIISRWLYILITPALGCYIVFVYWSAHPGLFDSGKARFTLLKKLGLPLLGAVLSGSIILLPQLWLSLNKPEGLAHSWLLGWSPANFFRREFENIDGHFIYQLPNWIYYAQPGGHPAYIFPVLGLAALWGVWRWGQTRQWGPLILLLGWAGPVYLFLTGIPYQNFRFGLTLYLPLVILAGYGLDDLTRRGAGEPENREEFTLAPPLRVLRSPATFKATIALSLAAMLLWAYPMLNSFLTAQNRSKLIARQVEQALPSDAALITFGLTLTMQHYTRLHTLELFFLDETSLKTLVESSDELYLLLDLPGIESQWQGKTPQLNYLWLKEHTRLMKRESFPPYTLFEIVR